MHYTWAYLINTFQSNTAGNYSRAGKISRYTADQLAAQAGINSGIAALNTYFAPLNAAYQQAMAAWITAGGVQEGATLGLKQLQAAINTDITGWEQAIKNTYMPGTPGYEAIFPHGITALKRGKRQDRIDRLSALSAALGAEPVLASIKTQVDARVAELDLTAGIQSGRKGLTKTSSGAVEDARLAVCTALYYVLGGLMQLYADRPDAIAAFFDLSTLRDAVQHHYTGAAAAHTTRNILKRSLSPTDRLTLTSDGNATLTFYLGATRSAAFNPAKPFVTVEPGHSLTVAAPALGSLPEATCLMVMNEDAAAGHWTVELL